MDVRQLSNRSFGRAIIPILLVTCTTIVWDERSFADTTLVKNSDRCQSQFKGKKVSSEDLARISATHEQWLDESLNPNGQRANLCQADLRGDNLEGVDFERIDLEEALLGDTNFSEAILHQAHLFGVKGQQANLSKASLDGADFRQAGMPSANFSEASLDDAMFINAML